MSKYYIYLDCINFTNKTKAKSCGAKWDGVYEDKWYITNYENNKKKTLNEFYGAFINESYKLHKLKKRLDKYKPCDSWRNESYMYPNHEQNEIKRKKKYDKIMQKIEKLNNK